MTALRIVVTMDCEPTTALTDASATGPATWAFGERAVTGYAEIARSYGLPVTFFVHPETATAQAAMFGALRDGGACLGLHVHPWKYAMSTHGGRRYLEHMGGLPEDEQRALVAETAQAWSRAFGERPPYFRPGTFSANDATYRVLADAGFRGCSCALPGRQMPEMRANWTGVDPDPHRANATFRQITGSLDMAEMPLSVDFSRTLRGRLGGTFHPDLRPDIDWSAQYGLGYDDIADAIVEQVVARAPAVPVVNLLTHNQFDFRDPEDPARQRLLRALDALMKACDARRVKPVGATMADVTAAVLALPPRDEAFVCEGNVYGRSGGVGTLATRAGG